MQQGWFGIGFVAACLGACDQGLGEVLGSTDAELWLERFHAVDRLRVRGWWWW